MLLDALHPPEQVREQLALGCNSPLGGDRFEIASKVRRRGSAHSAHMAHVTLAAVVSAVTAVLALGLGLD
jgi:hypothetical protein